MPDNLGNHRIVLAKRGSVTKWSQARKIVADYFTRPAVGLLAKTPIVPNALTWSGLAVNIAAAALIISGHLFAAGFVVLLAGFLDMLDGALARSTQRTTQFGAVLDSTIDRLSEAIVLLSILTRYAGEESAIAVLIVGLTLVGSLLVSYIRAKAEALGLKGEIGLFTRAERVVVLALGLLLNQIDYALIIALAIIMVFSFITVSQRLLYVWQQTKN